MMKKRILASSMASVMALTSVAAVAFAEDATTEVDYDATEVVTAKELKGAVQGYVEQKFGQKFDSFIDSGVYNYGSKTAQKFVEVIDYVKTIWDDSNITTEEASAAYQMVKAIGSRVKYYSAEELKILIESAKSAYSTNNALKGGLEGDTIYTDGTWNAFKFAYEDAETAVEGTDERGWTDAYEALEEAYGALTTKDIVTKAEYGQAKEAFEKINAVKYDTWRRGTIKLDNANLLNSSLKDIYNGVDCAYGTLYAHVNDNLNGIDTAYETFKADNSATRTTNDAIVAQYKVAKDGVTIMNAFAADKTDAASSNDVAKLLNKYKAAILRDYAPTKAVAMAQELLAKDTGITFNGNPVSGTLAASDVFTKPTKPVKGATRDTYDVTSKFTPAIKLYIGVDKDGYFVAGSASTSPVAIAGSVVKSVELKAGTEYCLIDYIAPISATEAIALTGSEVTSSLNFVVDGDAAVTENTDFYDGKNGLWFGNYLDSTNKWQAKSAGWLGKSENATAKIADYSNNKMVNWHGLTGGSTNPNTISSGVDIITALKLGVVYQATAKEGKFDTVNSNGTVNTDGTYGATLDILDSKIDTSGALSRFRVNNGVATNTAAETYINKGAAAEWTIVNRYLKYALEDKYLDPEAGSDEYHSRKDVDDLIIKCDDLARYTETANIFAKALKDMTDERERANAWSNNAHANKDYSDKKGAQTVVAYVGGQGTATDMYKTLYAKYEALDKLFKTWNTSFGTIRDEIGKASAVLEETGDEALKAAIDDCSNKLFNVKNLGIVDIVSDDDNAAFNTVSEFQPNNRCRSDLSANNDAEKSHKALYEAYTALKAAKEAALAAPEGLLGDVDGDGEVTAKDAAKILKALVDDTTAELENADFDADGEVTAKDAAAILKSLVD